MTKKRVNLIKARKKQKLTIRAVAKQLHVSKSSYSNYEQGKRRPRKFIAFAICKLRKAYDGVISWRTAKFVQSWTERRC